MLRAINSGIVTGDTAVSCSPSLVKVPDVFAKVNSAQIPSRFESSELVLGVKFTDFGNVTNLCDCV